jgi:signal transduction histidine kinase
METVRALATAVDKEISTSIAAVEILAASSSLASGDFRTFYDEAKGALHRSSAWENVTVLDLTGQQIVNLRRPFGEPLPRAVERDTIRAIVETGKPAVTNLVLAPIARAPRFAVRVPVFRDGKVTHVLTATNGPQHMQQILTRQQVPEHAVVAIVDRDGTVVARSRGFHEAYGRPASSTLLEFIRGKEEGFGITTTLEGEDVYTAFDRSPVTGWAVAMGIPRAAFDAPIARAYIFLSTAIVVSIVLGILGSLVVARTITRPIGQLRALARGERVGAKFADGFVPEIREAAEALERAHDEREKLLARERELRIQAEDTSRSKDEFLAMLGHELRNPLAAITAGVQVLNAAQPGAESHRRRALDIVERQTRQLSRLLDDLLDIGRVLTGKIMLKRAPVDLAIVAMRALEHVSTAANATQTMKLELAPAWTDADEQRLEQVVTNLLLNAVKYTPADGSISVRTAVIAGNAVLAVRDTGVGIEPGLLPKVFDLFVQGTRTLERAQGGLGIGLTLVRRLTELHGGSVCARSEGPGQGAEFEVRLPARAPPAAAAPVPGAPVSETRRRVLVVEDNADARDMIKCLLTLHGHDVHAAADGASGIRLALELRPEVALVDIGLPGIDGYEVASTIRSRLDGHVHLVAMTGYGLPEDQERARAAGFHEHIVKPVDEPTLLRAVAGGT